MPSSHSFLHFKEIRGESYSQWEDCYGHNLLALKECCGRIKILKQQNVFIISLKQTQPDFYVPFIGFHLFKQTPNPPEIIALENKQEQEDSDTD